MTIPQGLKIYKASAGSGKTHQLVGEYLRMVLNRPSSYRNILAVTFTNKATAEMKDRILKELSALAEGKDSGHLQRFREIWSDDVIREKAAGALKYILHDYSRFSVMTIDSFFQKIIRSFAREINLSSTFRTEIDSRQAMEDATDLLFQDIDENLLLRNWMVMFLEDNLEEGKSWDFKKELLRFGFEAEKEAFKIHGEELTEDLTSQNGLGDYINRMKQVCQESEARLAAYGEQGLAMIHAAGLETSHFKGKSRSFANHFSNLVAGKLTDPVKAVLEARDTLENWYNNNDEPARRQKIEELYFGGLNRLLVESVDVMAVEVPLINSARVILSNIYPFGLLGSMLLKMKEVLSEKNLVLLADSGKMISRIIDGSDTPFIYEKAGTIYRHFMLDEFQDTSRQQWNNFRPLVENALASGNPSLVVGDVKQSIYRWRNSDWNLLASGLQEDLNRQQTTTVTLDHNWRSRKNIVGFNNALFQGAARKLDQLFEEETEGSPFRGGKGIITEAYRGHCQKTPDVGRDGGYVNLTFLDTESNKKAVFMEAALELFIEQLERVQLTGVPPEEITVLVREHAEAEKVARALWERRNTGAREGCVYDVITSDSLKVGQSPVVRFIVDFFRFYTMKETGAIRAEILYLYHRIMLPAMGGPDQAGGDLHALFDVNSTLPDLFADWLNSSKDSEFQAEKLALPLYELVTSIAGHFGLGAVTGEKLYLQAFLDMVLEFGRNDGGGLPEFLEWWDSSGQYKTLNLTDVRGFIRISTIHQSKGLEYPTVFIPFCNWNTVVDSHKAPNLWCVPDREPFSQMALVLVKYGQAMKNSIFAADYYRELQFTLMDNINLLYVALTRAINNLFLILPWKKEPAEGENVAELLQLLLQSPNPDPDPGCPGMPDLHAGWNPETLTYELGRLVEGDRKRDTAELVTNREFVLHPGRQGMGIRLHSKDYFRLTGSEKAERINKGTLMHRVFEKIVTAKDVARAVELLEAEGALTRQEGEDLSSVIRNLISQDPVREWFDGTWKVLNERNILRRGAARHRPDRVLLRGDHVCVIDYKTGIKSDKDLRQVRKYLADLRKMGYASCEGFLWYINLNEVINVNQV